MFLLSILFTDFCGITVVKPKQKGKTTQDHLINPKAAKREGEGKDGSNSKNSKGMIEKRSAGL